MKNLLDYENKLEEALMPNLFVPPMRHGHVDNRNPSDIWFIRVGTVHAKFFFNNLNNTRVLG